MLFFAFPFLFRVSFNNSNNCDEGPSGSKRIEIIESAVKYADTKAEWQYHCLHLLKMLNVLFKLCKMWNYLKV